MHKPESGLQITPDLVDIRSTGFFLILFLPGLPAADAYEVEHIIEKWL